MDEKGIGRKSRAVPATVNCKKVSTKKPLLTREGVEKQKPGDLPDINLITKLSEEK